MLLLSTVDGTVLSMCTFSLISCVLLQDPHSDDCFQSDVGNSDKLNCHCTTALVRSTTDVGDQAWLSVGLGSGQGFVQNSRVLPFLSGDALCQVLLSKT